MANLELVFSKHDGSGLLCVIVWFEAFVLYFFRPIFIVSREFSVAVILECIRLLHPSHYWCAGTYYFNGIGIGTGSLAF